MYAYMIKEYCPRELGVREMMRANIQPALYRAIGCNAYFAVMAQRGEPLNGITNLVVSEESKVPIYKQHMQLQMGRVPKKVDVARKVFRVKQIDALEGEHGMYKVIFASQSDKY